MLIGVALLLAGAIVNAVGIQNRAALPNEAESEQKESVSATPA